VDFFFPEEIFPSPQATSSLPDVLHDPRVDFFLLEEIFISLQAISSLLDERSATLEWTSSSRND
jgi:hypothetical protein